MCFVAMAWEDSWTWKWWI